MATLGDSNFPNAPWPNSGSERRISVAGNLLEALLVEHRSAGMVSLRKLESEAWQTSVVASSREPREMGRSHFGENRLAFTLYTA